MRTALILGGADCLQEDVLTYCGPVDGVVACNDAGVWWPRKLDGWVTLHPRYMVETKFWLDRRAALGYPEAEAYFTHESPKPPVPEQFSRTSYLFPGQTKTSSSGMFAAKVALMDMGFDRVVLCGIPMTNTPHYWDQDAVPWRPAAAFAEEVANIEPEWCGRIRSMSGWTREFFGAP